MIELSKGGAYLLNGTEIIEDGSNAAAELSAKLGNAAPSKEEAAKNTIAYGILNAHNTSGSMDKLKIKFDKMTSHDITFVGIIQTARASGLEKFPIPYVLTNCHNSLCAVGGTINEDDHMFGLSTQYGFFIDSARCTGCKTCELACKDYKNLTPEVSFRRIYEYAGGDWQEDNGVWQQNVFAYYLSIACNHCEDPACTKVCPSGAMHKREDGFVVVNEEVCIGCRYCHMACPYGAPQYNADKGHMTKCDGCHERVAEGKKPICVESCPLRALDFGPIAELRAKHGQLAAVAPLPSAHFTRPSIVIKPNANARPCGDTTGYLANPKEV